MSEWLKDKATMNPPHMRDTSDPNDHNYSDALQEDSSLRMEEDGDGFGPPAPENAHGIPDILDSTIDMTLDLAAVSTGDGGGLEGNQHQDGFPTAPPQTTSTADFCPQPPVPSPM
jgi:hypothetical protein